MPRAWHLYDFSGYRGLKLENVALEIPGPGEVRVRVQAFALNWGDMGLMKDDYSFSLPQFPARIGIEAAGVIDAVGPDVVEHKIGDPVSTLPYFYYGRGASTESLIIEARYVVRTPKGLTPVEAASIWMQYLTAYYPIVEIAPLVESSFALVTAATSTAGAAAIEIGRARGATMIGTTRNPASAAYVREVGADHVIVQGQDDMSAEINRITDGKGVNFVFDAVDGGLIEQYGRVLAKDSKIYYLGFGDEESPRLPNVDMFRANATLLGYSVFNYVENSVFLKRGVSFVERAIASGDIRPRIDRVFDMEDLIAGWDYLSSTRTSHGKVVVKTGL